MHAKGVDLVLGLLQTAASAASSKPAETQASSSIGKVDFADVLKNSINQVNQTQQQAETLAANFAAGDSNTNLHDVMIALQTANVSFQEMVQVRNKLVSAYHDVMNIQV